MPLLLYLVRGIQAAGSAINQAAAATIRAWREHKGWDQSEMQGNAGISRSTYTRLEAGTTWITVDHVARIAAACNLPVPLFYEEMEKHHRDVGPPLTRSEGASLRPEPADTDRPEPPGQEAD